MTDASEIPLQALVVRFFYLVEWKMARQRWSEEDENFILDNYNKIPTSDIANYLNRSIRHIYNRAAKLGLKKETNSLSKEEKQFIIDNYGKIATKEISKIINRTSKQINGIATYYHLKGNKHLFIPDNKLTFEEIQNRCKNLDIKLISTTYNNCKESLKFICNYCNKPFNMSMNEISRKILNNRPSINCGCISVGKRKGLKYISGTHFSQIKDTATKKRNLEFTVTIEYIENLLIDQNFKCALTNLDLVYGYKTSKEITASLDRIDSLQGYTENNVQWVHKHINFMKWDFTQEEFINYCKLVAKHHED